MMVEAKEIVDLFNKLIALDPVATAELVGHRVSCNESLLADEVPFVCSRTQGGVISMGVVGFVNALSRPGTGYAAAIYDADKNLTGFTVVGAE